MTVAFWCVLVASLMPIVCTGIAKARSGGFDNHDPRGSLARLHGVAARANAAQQNCWEALAVFGAGVFVAHIANAPQSAVDGLAMAFILVRVVYIACYLADLATLRSIVWLTGFLLSLSFYFL